MQPLEQYRHMLFGLTFQGKESRHFHTTEHVPMKHRAPMFGLTTIDADSWLIGDRAVLSRSRLRHWPADTPGLISSWTAESDGYHYAICHAPAVPPASRPWEPHDDNANKSDDAPTLLHISGSGPLPARYDHSNDDGDNEIGEVTAKCVFTIGDACIKMHHTVHCDSADEHLTIAELSSRLPLPARSFGLPRVLYHARYDNRYFLVTSRLPGKPAEKIWWDLDDSDKDFYADLIAQSCVEVAALTSDSLGAGIDGVVPHNARFAGSLTRKDAPDVLENCKTVGLSTQSPFHLFHEDLGPTNVIIDRERREIGIIDWQAAAYVPKEWISVNFARALAMVQGGSIPEGYKINDYAQRVWKALGKRGFGGNDGMAWLDWIEVDWEGSLASREAEDESGVLGGTGTDVY